MTIGLEDQIRDYAYDVHENEKPLTVDEITEMRFGTESVRPIGLHEHPVDVLPRRRLLAAVAGAVAVLVLGLSTILIRQTTPEAPPASQPSPTPTVVTPAPVPPTPIEGSASDWSRIAHDEAVFGDALMWSVAVGGPGLVAVGGESFWLYGPEDIDPIDPLVWTDSEYEVGNGDAVVWTSPDGITWSRLPNEIAVFGGDGEQQMLSVTAGGPGLVAVGFDGGLDNQGSDAAVWTSVDGIVWSRVPLNESVFGGDGQQRMLSVTVGGPGLVAVGFDTTLDADRADAAVWTSPDGITWSRVPHVEAVFGGAGAQQMLSVTTGGPGLVAVGNDGYDDDEVVEKADWDAAVWTSPDGITWSRVPHDELVFGGDGQQRMLDVTAGGPGLVAVGYEGGLYDQRWEAPDGEGSDAAVWTSPDGIAWSRVPYDEAVFGGRPGGGTGHLHWRMTSVISGGPGVVAVGSTGVDGPFGSAVWTSPDGITWSRVAIILTNGYTRMFDVTVGDSGLVAVGRLWGGEVPRAAVWQN